MLRINAVLAPGVQSPASVYLRSLSSAASRETMRKALTKVCALFGSTPETFPWHALRYEHVSALRSYLAGHYSPATANKVLAGLKGVLRQAHLLGQIDADAYLKATSIDRVKGGRVTQGRCLTEPETAALLAQCDTLRHLSLFMLALGAGLRRTELLTLEVRGIKEDHLRVLGKGNKERTVYPPAAVLAVVKERAAQVAEGRLYKMSHAGLYKLLRRKARAAGITGRISPHDLRRTYISRLLGAGVDIATVAACAGHSNISTTQLYDLRGENAKKAAAEKVRL